MHLKYTGWPSSSWHMLSIPGTRGFQRDTWAPHRAYQRRWKKHPFDQNTLTVNCTGSHLPLTWNFFYDWMGRSSTTVPKLFFSFDKLTSSLAPIKLPLFWSLLMALVTLHITFHLILPFSFVSSNNPWMGIYPLLNQITHYLISQGQLFHWPGLTLVAPSFPVKSYLYAFLLVELKIVQNCTHKSIFKICHHI